MCFTIFQNEEMPFETMKTRSRESRKIVIFPKGLVHSFGKKLVLFPHFFKKKKQAKQMCFTISQKERNASLGYKKKKFKKSKNCDFSKGVSPWFWPKNGNFSRFLFQQKQARKISFMIFQKEETPLQTIKSRS